MSTLCLNCRHARNPADLSNLDKGWIGCALLLIDSPTINPGRIEAIEYGEGWIDRSYPHEEKSGHIISLQLLHKEVSVSPYFEQR